MFPESFSKLQKQLLENVEEIRARTDHPGIKGEGAENLLKDLLERYLPQYNRLGSGEIIDSHGNKSKQIDIVILNQYHPFLSDTSRQSTFLIEGVAGVGEVKTALTYSNLDSALENCRKFKRLRAEVSGQVIYTGGTNAWAVHTRPYFLFAYETKLTRHKILERIAKFHNESSVPPDEQIDAIFILETGFILNLRPNMGYIGVKDSNGDEFHGLFLSKHLDSELFVLLAWLSANMPNLIYTRSILSLYWKLEGALE